MQVTEIRYTKKFNLGNYESEDFSVVAVINETEDMLAVFDDLKKEVARAYAGDKNEVPKTEGKKKKSKPAPAPEPEDDEEMPPQEAAETEVEDDAPPAKAAKGKAKKPKTQNYDRNNETHKEIFSNVLKGVAPDWKKTPESKAKAKSASQAMEGEEFLDDDGEVLESFSTQVKKLMKAK